MVWAFYSIVILGAAIAVASESKQVRHMHRVSDDLPATVLMPDGRAMHARCRDFSMGGMGVEVPGLEKLDRQTELHISLYAEGVEHAFPVRVAQHNASGMLGLELLEMNIEQKLAYVQCTFARIGVWQNWTKTQASNTMTQTIARIVEISWMNYRIFLQRMAAQLRKVLTLKFSEPPKQASK